MDLLSSLINQYGGVKVAVGAGLVALLIYSILKGGKGSNGGSGSSGGSGTRGGTGSTGSTPPPAPPTQG